jgi:hypothetical protein
MYKKIHICTFILGILVVLCLPNGYAALTDNIISAYTGTFTANITDSTGFNNATRTSNISAVTTDCLIGNNCYNFILSNF